MAREGWLRMRLGDFVTLQRGHDLPEQQRRPGRVPILGSFGITGWHNASRTPGPGVTVGRSGASLGVVSYSPLDFWPLNTALYVIDFHGNDPRFAYYFLKTFDFHSYNSGSAQPSLNRNFIHPVPVDVPPVPEQRAIAHILGNLEDKITLNRRINATLEDTAKAIFKSWFVDFDPTTAKAEGKDTGLARSLSDAFPDAFEDSPLGSIPEGWSVKLLADVAMLMVGGDWGRDTPLHGDVSVRCLRGIDLAQLRVAGWSAAPVRFVSDESLRKRTPAPTDVFVEGSGECGRSLAFSDPLAALYDEPITYSNFCKRFRCPSASMALYVEYILNGLVASGEMKGFVTGTAMPNLDHKGLLSGLSIIVPSPQVLEAFSKVVGPIRQVLFGTESRTLGSLHDTLLPKLISGELQINDAARIVAAL